MEKERQIQSEEAKQFKNNNKLDLFFETSVKTRFNIPKILIEAAKLLYNTHENSSKNNEIFKPEKIIIFDSDEESQKRRRKKCL